ncbi:MAG: uroporphyrinogen-III synthase [Rhodospirillales bacterium]|nr:uroporphyrinogen-III synthase [Rhodospirillales bacterium]
MDTPRAVLVTRPEAEAAATAARLSALGWTPLIAPMLRIRRLEAEIPDAIAAIALTSGNAVPFLPERLHALPVFAVGDATAARARAAGFADVRSAGADAEALARLIAAEAPPGPLLLAVGRGRGETLAAALEAQGRAVQRREVYAADPEAALPSPAAAALRGGEVAAAMFFSAETARAFVRLAEAEALGPALSGVIACAIGAPAVMALGALPWREIRQAAHPTQEAMLELLPMTDEAASAEPPSPPAPSEPPLRAAPTRHWAGPALGVLGFALLAGGLAYLWQRPLPPAANSSHLESEIAALRARPNAAPAPAPIPPALLARLVALEQGTHGIETRLAALEQRMAALDARGTAQASAAATATTALRARLDALSASEAGLTAKLDALSASSGATARLAALQAARAALAAGQPLGALPGAPPALARFATAAPPTEAALRLDFAEAAHAALAAAAPAPEGGFWHGLLARAATLVTVRQGSKVILGNPASGPIGAARTRLLAGDLAGAVAALNTLSGKPAAAMASWRDEAQALLAARAALDAMIAAPPPGGEKAPAPGKAAGG